MYQQAEKLRRLMSDDGQRWVFLKGGHLPGSDCIDLFFDGDEMHEMPATRIQTPHTHGTGCTLSAALAALLPQYDDAAQAARAAKEYLYKAIARADELKIGHGHGPIYHFAALGTTRIPTLGQPGVSSWAFLWQAYSRRRVRCGQGQCGSLHTDFNF